MRNKEELEEVAQYTRKMVPRVMDCINEFAGADPPKPNIVFAPISAIRSFQEMPENMLIKLIKASFYIYLENQPLIVLQIHNYLKLLNKCRHRTGEINPAHYLVIQLAEEYGHYVYDWLHEFKIPKEIGKFTENEKGLEGFISFIIVKGRLEAAGEIASQKIAELFDYSDDIESFLFLLEENTRMRLLRRDPSLLPSSGPLFFAGRLGEYYAENLKEMNERDFQRWIRQDPFKIDKKDLIEAKTILNTVLY